MKNIFKALIIMILTFAMSIPMQMIVKASTYTDMGTKKDVVVSKPWTVSFNKSLSYSTVNTTNIKVVGENNNYVDINVSLGSNNKNVIVSPVKNYEPNKTYTLVVTDKVKSDDGNPLPKEVRMEFNTKSAVIITKVPTKPSEMTICIDPAQYYTLNTGKNGAKAKDINLSTALKLGTILKTRGFNVVYTRNSDSVSWDKLNEDDAKVTIAKNAKADVFLSINTNSTSNTEASGIETYYLDDGGNNKLLASSVQGELIKATEAADRGIKVAMETANFDILKKTSCPGVVLELGFLSNPIEEALLSKPEYQENAAKAIANGLMSYAGFTNKDTAYDSIFEISSVQDITVNLQAGSKYTFPKTMQATMSNNVEKEVAVKWGEASVSLNELGIHAYEGVITNYDGNVRIIINVTKKTYKVVLDPGHGGADSGAIGAVGLKERTEKNLVLTITKKVGAILTKNGVETIYTRTIDETQSLQAKCDVSNDTKPDYFVSIHANAAVPQAHGIETFYCSGNAAGAKLAKAVQTELVKATGRTDRGIKTAGFYVLNNTDATAILVETSFLSNPEEGQLLNTVAYQDKVAKAIATGILKSLGITKIVY
ncbi:MAG: N-acetylmuramoyl-L-alanine amidase [Clostridium sp.]|jgi:N-acetylmuramoyl-L-alanine amidase